MEDVMKTEISGKIKRANGMTNDPSDLMLVQAIVLRFFELTFELTVPKATISDQ